MKAPYFIIANNNEINFFDLPKPTNSVELEQFKARYVQDFGERAQKSLEISEIINKSFSLGRELEEKSWDDSFIIATKKVNEAINSINQNGNSEYRQSRITHIYDEDGNLVKVNTSRYRF